MGQQQQQWLLGSAASAARGQWLVCSATTAASDATGASNAVGRSGGVAAVPNFEVGLEDQS